MNHITERTKVIPVSIASGASQSNVIDLEGLSMLAIEMPSQWTTAALTFLAAPDSTGTFLPIYDDGGTEVTVAAPAAARMISLDTIALKLAPYRYVKLRSGTAAASTNQAAARTLKIHGKV